MPSPSAEQNQQGKDGGKSHYSKKKKKDPDCVHHKTKQKNRRSRRKREKPRRAEKTSTILWQIRRQRETPSGRENVRGRSKNEEVMTGASGLDLTINPEAITKRKSASSGP